MRQTHNKAFNDLFKRNRHAWIRAETELVSVGSKGTGFLGTDIVAVCMLAFCHLNLCQAYGTDHLYMVYQISLLIIITDIITDNDVDEESGVGRLQPDHPVYNMIKMMTMMMLMMTAKNMITMMTMMMMMKRKDE